MYPVLKAMEESGRCRRGYFVEGLGGAQFALPGAVDRLRAAREPAADDEVGGRTVVLAATDPANPYGAALGWPDPAPDVRHRPRRVAGAHVVTLAGRLVLYAERGGRSLLTFGGDPDELAAAAGALAGLVTAGTVASFVVQRVDGGPLDAGPAEPVVAGLRAAGFVDHPRGLVLRHRPGR